VSWHWTAGRRNGAHRIGWNCRRERRNYDDWARGTGPIPAAFPCHDPPRPVCRRLVWRLWSVPETIGSLPHAVADRVNLYSPRNSNTTKIQQYTSININKTKATTKSIKSNDTLYWSMSIMYSSLFTNRKLDYKQLIKYYSLLQNWQKRHIIYLFWSPKGRFVYLNTWEGGVVGGMTTVVGWAYVCSIATV